MAELLAIAVLAASLIVAVARPAALDEAVVSVPGAILLVVLGVVPYHDALHTIGEIGPTVGFLAAILVFGHLCAEAGVFEYLGAVAARTSRGRSVRLLTIVVTLAAVVTAVLTLDATVVLLTPVVLATAARLHVVARPHAYACARLANSGSLLLPVSNLTNLLAFSAADLSFGRFAALMCAPWLLVCAAEWSVLRSFFAHDLRAQGAAVADGLPVPRFAMVVLAATVAGIVVTSSLHIAPAWVALAGCIAMLVPRALRHDVDPRRVLAEASPGFCVFVLALAVIVDGVMRHGVHSVLVDLIPSGSGFPALLAVTFLAAALANLVNNLPATLALVPLVAASPAAVLAMLLGVNIGPNATFGGSLATLLWRRLVPGSQRPTSGQFHLIGMLTVPLLLLVAAAALWAGVRVVGV